MTTFRALLFLRATFTEETIRPNPRIIVSHLETCRNSNGNNSRKTLVRSGNPGTVTDHRLRIPLPSVIRVTDHTMRLWIALRLTSDLQVRLCIAIDDCV